MRLAMHTVSGKAAVRGTVRASAVPSSSRASSSVSRCCRRAAAVVCNAAADPSAAAPAPQQQQQQGQQKQQQQRRQRRPVTVQLATITPGQELDGTVVSVEAYGAFVDVGSEAQGLVHVSQLSDGYVKNVADAVKVGDKVKVKVLTVDAAARRLALSMKGMGNAPAAAAGKRGGGARGGAEASFEDAEADGDDADDAFVMEAGDVAMDGAVFRVEDAEYDAEGYDEADEYEAAAEADVALAALEGAMVDGTVASVEQFGVVVEWAGANGAKQSGLLHVSEMRAPAAAADAELGGSSAAAAASADDEPSFFADEAEYESEQYVDVGGVDNPSRYYKPGDKVSCYVLAVEGRKVSLTQDLESLALDGAADDADEAFDLEEERALARAEADAAGAAAAAALAFGDEGEDGADDVPAPASDAAAALYLGASSAAAKTGAAPAFIRGKRGASVAPGGFPSRGLAVADADLRVAAASRLIDVDDAGDEAELVDYWSNEAAGRLGKLSAYGGTIVAGDEGELVVKAREGEGAGSDDDDFDALALLGGATDADIDALVDALLGGDDEDAEDEAELPFLARRNPGSRA